MSVTTRLCNDSWTEKHKSKILPCTLLALKRGEKQEKKKKKHRTFLARHCFIYLFLVIILNFMITCKCAYVSLLYVAVCKSHLKALDCLDMELQMVVSSTTLVLGTKLGSSGRLTTFKIQAQTLPLTALVVR